MPGINQARNNKGKDDKFKRKNIEMKYADSNGAIYGIVKQEMGNCRFKIETLNGEIKYATPEGVIKKHFKIAVDNFVLIEPISNDESSNYHIIFRYTPAQKKQLEKEGCLNKKIDPIKKEEKERLETGIKTKEDIVFGSVERVEDSLDLINDLFIDNIMKRKK